jgi:Zn-dependent protease with chaperone function
MNKPIYQKEKTLFAIAAVLAGLVWGGLILATKGLVLLVLPVSYIAYLFAMSGFISHLKGTGALVSDSQFPDIQERVKYCAQKVGLKAAPGVYILHGNGVFNAFAAKFLRKTYIVLLSDILDAVEERPEAINFYIGHEMGHIDRRHLTVAPFISIALILPLLGAAYSRAREYTCDLYGAACCSPEAAQHGLGALAVGGRRYKTMNIAEYLGQARAASGFWMSFHELIASYPWLVKRVARISPDAHKKKMPGRNPLAYLFAAFVPRLNLVSLAVIYILFLVMAGAIKGQHLVREAQQKSAAIERSTAKEFDRQMEEMGTGDNYGADYGAPAQMPASPESPAQEPGDENQPQQ